MALSRKAFNMHMRDETEWEGVRASVRTPGLMRTHSPTLQPMERYGLTGCLRNGIPGCVWNETGVYGTERVPMERYARVPTSTSSLYMYSYLPVHTGVGCEHPRMAWGRTHAHAHSTEHSTQPHNRGRSFSPDVLRRAPGCHRSDPPAGPGMLPSSQVHDAAGQAC
jgi:hypothetical protein